MARNTGDLAIGEEYFLVDHHALMIATVFGSVVKIDPDRMVGCAASASDHTGRRNNYLQALWRKFFVMASEALDRVAIEDPGKCSCFHVQMSGSYKRKSAVSHPPEK